MSRAVRIIAGILCALALSTCLFFMLGSGYSPREEAVAQVVEGLSAGDEALLLTLYGPSYEAYLRQQQDLPAVSGAPGTQQPPWRDGAAPVSPQTYSIRSWFIRTVLDSRGLLAPEDEVVSMELTGLRSGEAPWVTALLEVNAVSADGAALHFAAALPLSCTWENGRWQVAAKASGPPPEKDADAR